MWTPRRRHRLGPKQPRDSKARQRRPARGQRRGGGGDPMGGHKDRQSPSVGGGRRHPPRGWRGRWRQRGAQRTVHACGGRGGTFLTRSVDPFDATAAGTHHAQVVSLDEAGRPSRPQKQREPGQHQLGDPSGRAQGFHGGHKKLIFYCGQNGFGPTCVHEQVGHLGGLPEALVRL